MFSFGTFLREVHEEGFDKVTEVHLRLFRHLDPNGTRLTEIAARARTTKQTMAELLDKTEALGLVARQPTRVDGRAKIIVFTRTGLRLLEHIGRGTGVCGTAFRGRGRRAVRSRDAGQLERYLISPNRLRLAWSGLIASG